MGDLGSERRKIERFRQGGGSFRTTRLDAVLGWGRKYPVFSCPFVTACCGMEFMSRVGPRFDLVGQPLALLEA